MNTKSVFEDALQLRPAERLLLIEMLAKSLNMPMRILKKYGQMNQKKDIKLLKKIG